MDIDPLLLINVIVIVYRHYLYKKSDFICFYNKYCKKIWICLLLIYQLNSSKEYDVLLKFFS